MTKFYAILLDSFLEIKARKIFYLYWAVTIVTVLVLALLPDIKINGTNILESEMVPPEFIDRAVGHFFDGYFGFMIFLMVFGSAGLAPSYLGKGRIELALSKPIDRLRLLFMKFASIFVIMGVILAVSAVLVWLTMSIRMGAFSTGFFWGLGLALTQYLVILCIIVFFGVLSHSAVVAIMGYFMMWFVANLLSGREVLYPLIGESVWKTILDAIYHVLPKIGEMSENYVPLMLGDGITQAYPVWSSLLFGVAVLLVGMVIFNRRDY